MFVRRYLQKRTRTGCSRLLSHFPVSACSSQLGPAFQDIRDRTKLSSLGERRDTLQLLKEYDADLVRGLTANGLTLSLKNILKHMKYRGNAINNNFWVDYFKMCRVLKDAKLAWATLESLPLRREVECHQQVAYLTLRTCGMAGDPHRAIEVMGLMKRTLRMPLTSRHYDTLIQAYAVSGDVQGAMSTFSQLQTMALPDVPVPLHMATPTVPARPTDQTVNVVLLACAKAGDFQNAKIAFGLATRVSSTGLPPPNCPAWGLLVQAGAKAGALEECHKILSELTGLLSERTAEDSDGGLLTSPPQPFNNLLAAYRAVGDHVALTNVLQLMYQAKVGPDMHTYSTLITALGEGLSVDSLRIVLPLSKVWPPQLSHQAASSTDGVELILTSILRSGGVPNPVVWRCVCRHFVSAGDLPGLRRMAQLVLSQDPFLPCAKENTLSTLGDGVLSMRAREETPSSKKHQDLRKKEWMDTRGEIWPSLVGAAGQLGLWEEALHILRDLESELAKQPQRTSVITGYDRHTCWLRAVRAAISSGGANTPLPWRRALLVLKEIRRVHPQGATMTLWKHVLVACAENGTADDVVELLQRMHYLDGHFPDQAMWDSIVTILSSRYTSVSVAGVSDYGSGSPSVPDKNPRQQCEADLFRKYIASSPLPLKREVVTTVHRQLRNFSDYAVLVKSFLGKNGHGIGRVEGGSSSGGAPVSSGGNDGDGEDEEGGDSLCEDSSRLMSRMRKGYQEGDVYACIQVGDELFSQPEKSSKGEEITVTPLFFEMLMEVCVDKGVLVERLEKFYSYMVEELGMFPTAKAMRLVVLALCSIGKVEQAVHIIRSDLLENDDLRGKMTPEEAAAVVRPIIDAFIAKRSHDKASLLLEDMGAVQLASNGPYSSLLRGYMSLKDLDRCLVSFEAWTRNCVLEGQTSSDVCRTLFEMIWIPTPLNNRPALEKWALSHTFVETLFQRKASSDVVRSCGLLYIQRILTEKPSDIQKYLTLLLQHPTHVAHWEDFLTELANFGRDEEAEWALQCMNSSSHARDAFTPKPSVNCWGYVSMALCAKERYTEAWEMLQFISTWVDIPEAGAPKVKPDDPLPYWRAFLQTVGDKGHFELGWDAIDTMREARLSVDEGCWRGVIAAALHRGNAKAALKALQEMTEVDKIDKPSASAIYVPLLEHLAERDMAEEVIGVITDMESRSVAIDSKTWKKIEKMRRFDIIADAFGRV